MKTIFYKNKHDQSVFKLITKTATNDNFMCKDAKIQVLLQDVLTGGFLFMSPQQFEQDYKIHKIEADNDEESDENF